MAQAETVDWALQAFGCELRRIGYDPARRTFTPREVAAIAAMLGEP